MDTQQLYQQLAYYIQEQLRAGYNIDLIRSSLLKQGYTNDDINYTINSMNQQKINSLITYVNQQAAKGVSSEEMREQLLHLGYPLQDIKLAMDSLSPKSNSKLIFFSVLVALVILGLGVFLMMKPFSTTDNGIKTPPSTIPIKTPITTPENKTLVENVSPRIPPPSDNILPPVKNDSSVIITPPSQDNTSAENLTAPPADTEPPEDNQPTGPPPVVETPLQQLLREASEAAAKDPNLGITKCKEAENDLHRDECFNRLALKMKTDRLCGEIQETEKKDTCYMNFFLEREDPEMCKKITSSTLKKICGEVDTNVTAVDYILGGERV